MYNNCAVFMYFIIVSKSVTFFRSKKSRKYPIYKNPISVNPENGCSCMRVFTVSSKKLKPAEKNSSRRGIFEQATNEVQIEYSLRRLRDSGISVKMLFSRSGWLFATKGSFHYNNPDDKPC